MLSGAIYVLVGVVAFGALITYIIGQRISAAKETYNELIRRVLRDEWVGSRVIPPTAEQAAVFDKLKVYIVLRRDGKYVVSVDGPYGINYDAWLCTSMESAKEREKDMTKRLRDWKKLPKLVPGIKTVTNVGEK